jgi:alkylation response protein AidB-like acyl-CoA dehydrogenase
MDFDFTPADEEFRREFRSWLEANSSDAPPPRNIFMTEGKEAFDEQVRWGRKLATDRWLAVNWPKEYGCRGATVLQTIVYEEELARLGLGAPMVGMGTTLLGPTLLHWGTEEQKHRYIPKILKGEEIWCQGYSEPGAGSDLASLQTRAVEDGDDFIVNGQKVWTSMAQFADMIFLLVRTDPMLLSTRA